MPRHTTVRKNDTEPLKVRVQAGGVSNLDDVSSVHFYMWVDGGADVVSGATSPDVEVHDSDQMIVSIDPDGIKDGGGNMLDTVGEYKAYLKLTWLDGNETRHPKGHDLGLTVKETRE